MAVWTVETGSRFIDVGFDNSVTQGDERRTPSGVRQNIQIRWEDSTREVIDQRVRPRVAGCVRQIAVGESQDLELAVFTVWRILIQEDTPGLVVKREEIRSRDRKSVV